MRPAIRRQTPDAGADAAAPDAGLACAPRPPVPSLRAPGGVAAGTRLVPRTMREPVAGGVEVPMRVRDTVLGVDCEPRRFEDGTITCFPLDFYRATAAFADPTLTIPVALAPSFDLPAPGALAVGEYVDLQNDRTGPFDCDHLRPVAFFRIGAERAGAEAYGPFGQPIPVGDNLRMFDVAPEPNPLVPLTEVRTQLTGTIALRELHGGDGSRLFPAGLYDTAHDVPLALRTGRLLPSRAGAAGRGAHLDPPPDDLATLAWCAEPSQILLRPDEAACRPARFISDGTVVHEVVEKLVTLYSCIGTKPTPNVALQVEEDKPILEVCGTSPVAEWPVATAVTAGARLTARTFTIEGAAFVEPRAYPTFSDAVLGAPCEPRDTSDGHLLCIPHPAPLGSVAYADPACTSPVVAWSGAGTPTHAALGTRAGSSTGDGYLYGTLTLFGVGAARPPGTVYAPTFQLACKAFEGIPSWELGPQLPSSPGPFAELEIREP
ncbi:MAG: hypothetical protein KIT31_06300 [Deltaproteobacteria bacterium]|nr:hypothetical protein [Deltaproteobacteria bacterium]